MVATILIITLPWWPSFSSLYYHGGHHSRYYTVLVFVLTITVFNGQYSHHYTVVVAIIFTITQSWPSFSAGWTEYPRWSQYSDSLKKITGHLWVSHENIHWIGDVYYINTSNVDERIMKLSGKIYYIRVEFIDVTGQNLSTLLQNLLTL